MKKIPFVANINKDGEEIAIPTVGYVVDVPEHPGYLFVAARHVDGRPHKLGGWALFEITSGAQCGNSAKTRAEAVTVGQAFMAGITPERMQSAWSRFTNRHAIAELDA